MNKLFVTIILAVLYSAHLARAAEFQEHAMCTSTNPASAFPRISLQTDPLQKGRGVLILQATDGWTQVYSGPVKQTVRGITFSEDEKIVSASFDKTSFIGKMTFNEDIYRCDERSFGQ